MADVAASKGYAPEDADLARAAVSEKSTDAAQREHRRRRCCCTHRCWSRCCLPLLAVLAATALVLLMYRPPVPSVDILATDPRLLYIGRWRVEGSLGADSTLAATADWPCVGVRFSLTPAAEVGIVWRGVRTRLNATVHDANGTLLSSRTLYAATAAQTHGPAAPPVPPAERSALALLGAAPGCTSRGPSWALASSGSPCRQERPRCGS
jgi:hypothetical protein